MQTALRVTVPGRHPSTPQLQGRQPGKPESQPGNCYGIRICHSTPTPWGLGTGRLQGRAISGDAEPRQAACPTAGEPAAEQLRQASHFQEPGIFRITVSWFGSLNGLLTKETRSESVLGLGLWDSPAGFSHSQNPESPCSLPVTQG